MTHSRLFFFFFERFPTFKTGFASESEVTWKSVTAKLFLRQMFVPV